MEFEYILLSNAVIALIGYFSTSSLIPTFSEIFLSSNRYGKDMNKKTSTKIPEGLGVISSAVYLMCLVFFMPFAFISKDDASQTEAIGGDNSTNGIFNFDRKEFIQFNGGLLSICLMTLFGFADDVLNLKWRLKLCLPAMASLPLLMVYYTNIGNTSVVIPKFLRDFVGTDIQLGPLYYLYMGMLTIFCTNAINILSGINGLEAGQSVFICLSIIIHNVIELSGPVAAYHRFSLYFMIPFLATTLALLKYNWYPARIFVGDTFCYTAGMAFAVVGILGHFSKTMLLFFIPQLLNFAYSLPQLFHFLPCPRHRLPKFNLKTGLVGMSKARSRVKDISRSGMLMLTVLELLHVVDSRYEDVGGEDYVEFNNLTLNNFILKIFGPMKEYTLTKLMLAIQILCSAIAFFIRYTVADSLYH